MTPMPATTAVIVMAAFMMMFVLVTAPFITIVVMVTEMAAGARALFHKIHRLATGGIARAVLGPVLGMARRHIHIDGSARHGEGRWSNHHGLWIQQRRRPAVADIHSPIHTGGDLPTDSGIHVSLRMGRAGCRAQRCGHTRRQETARAKQMAQKIKFHHHD